MNKSNKSFLWFVFGSVIITNLSQMPTFVETRITRLISNPIWILLLIVCLISDQTLELFNVRGFFCLLGFFVLYMGVGTLFGNPFMNSSIDKQIFLSAFVMFVGTFVGKRINLEDLEKISTAYIWSALIVCVNVYFTYIVRSSWDSRIYAYGSKNSISQILLFAAILIVFLKLKIEYSTISKIFYIVSLMLLVYTLLGLKSRASLIGIPIVAIVTILNQDVDKHLKTGIITVIIGITFFLILKPEIYDSLVNNVILGGRSSNNLDDISSGRVDEWSNFFMDFGANGFFGDSYDKRESIFLSAFLQHGFVGGVLVSMMVFYPYAWFRRNHDKCGGFANIMKSIIIVSIVNGVFEQQAPFGPGAKCFFLWFLLGIFSTMDNNEDRLEYGAYE